MKDQEWYNKLWRDKLQQLPVEGDEHAMWQKMQGLLDEEMPVSNPGTSGKPGKFPGGGAILPAVVIIAATLALIYFLSGHSKEGKHKEQIKAIKSIVMHRDSLNNAKIRQSQVDDNTANSKAHLQPQNSSTAVNKTIMNATSSAYKNTLSANTANNTSSSSKITPLSNLNPKVNNSNHISANNIIGVRDKKEDYNKHAKNVSLITGSYSGHLTHLHTNGRGNPKMYSSQHHSVSGIANAAQNNSGNPSGLKNSRQQNPGQQQAGMMQLLTNNSYPSFADTLTTPGIIDQTNITDSLSKQFRNGLALGENTLTIAKNSLGNSASNNTNKSQSAQNNKTKDKPTSSKNNNGKSRPGNSSFSLDAKLGMNTGAGSSAYFGIAAGYNFTPRVSLMIGADVLPSRTLSGSYNSKTQLTYRVDTGKYGTRQSGQIIISGSRKLYTVDVPVTVNYRINQYLSIYGGPVISLPAKANATKTSLTKLANSNDTTRSLVAPYLSGTVIDNKAGINLTGGVKLNFNRVFISGGYMQALQPYTISSGLGSSKINYHTVQLGVGLRLFKPKGKKAFVP
jgi:hypothetical protein